MFSGTPMSGKWVWTDDPLIPRLEFISNIPAADRPDIQRRTRVQEGKVHGDRAASGGLSTRAKRGLPPKLLNKVIPSKKEQTEHTTVTLDDIKTVSLERMSEVAPISDQFYSLFRREQLDMFLLYLLSYFNCYFNKLTLDNMRNTMYIEPSVSEKAEYAGACERLNVAQKLLGRAYCILLLGLGLEEQHHMECGRSRVSKTYTDRSLFESFYNFCTFFVWITFLRKEFDQIKKEIGRILRSDTFNPAIRVKYAAEDSRDIEPSRVPKPVTKNEEERKRPESDTKLSAAEYRHLHPKRPALKSIINQRSPVIVSILPYPKEEASWLFRRLQLQNEDFSAQPDEDSGKNVDEKYADIILDIDRFKTGILGEPYKMFNPQTLSPLGMENEEEETVREEDNGTSEGGGSGDKSQVSDQGPSQQQTAVSHATTEALTEEET